MDFSSQWYGYANGAIDYQFDLTSCDQFPLESESVSFFYSSHTLEHIPQEYCQHILDEMFRCLKHGGTMRLTMPDFDLAYEAFAENSIGFFVKSPGKGIEDRFLDFFATYLKGKVPSEELHRDFSSMEKESFANYYMRHVP